MGSFSNTYGKLLRLVGEWGDYSLRHPTMRDKEETAVFHGKIGAFRFVGIGENGQAL